jgi:SAM-dependent methyltransferase
MADVYAMITDAEPALVAQLAEVLELRAADPQQAAMRQAYLGDIRFPAGARVLEVGCGTGAVTRELAGWPGVAEVVGLDPSPTFLASARRHHSPGNVEFVEGDARALQFQDRSFDVVVFHTTLCHVPEPERALRQAARAAAAAGFTPVRMRSHGYVETREARYSPTIVDRGAAALVAQGGLGAEAANALRAEARGRATSGQFFGHIAYASLVATLAAAAP